LLGETNDRCSTTPQDLDNFDEQRQEGASEDENQMGQVVEEQKEVLPESLVGK